MTTPPPGLPGFGAEELASRASRRAARLRREQELSTVADAAVQKQIDQAVRRQQTYSQGAEGERLVAQTLGFVERYGWASIHDVHWPGRPQANIDHIAVGPGGVVVIDAKNWTGDVKVTGGTLRQNGYPRSRETSAAADAAAAVAALLAPHHRMSARAVICLVSHDLETTRVEATDVVGRGALTEYLVDLPQRLSAYDVADIARYLHGQLAGAKSPDMITSAYLDRAAPTGSTVRPPRSRTSSQRHSPPAPQARRPARGRPAPRPGLLHQAAIFFSTFVRKLLSLTLRLILIFAIAGIGISMLNSAFGEYVDRQTQQTP